MSSINGLRQSEMLSDVRLSGASETGNEHKTESPKSKGFIGSIMAFFGFSSKAESEQQSAQKTSWMQSIKSFFGFGDSQSKSSTASASPLKKGVKADWGQASLDKLNEADQTLKDYSPDNIKRGEVLQSATNKVQKQSQNVGKGQTSNNTAPVSVRPQSKINIMSSPQEKTTRESMNPRDSELADFDNAPPKKTEDQQSTKQASASTKNVLTSSTEALNQRSEKLNNVAKGTDNMKSGAKQFAGSARSVNEQLKAQNDAWNTTLNTITFGLLGEKKN